MLSNLIRLAVASVIALIAVSSFGAQNGERWEYQTRMQLEQMEGMALPAMTMQVCNEPGWKTPPKGQQQDSDCKINDYQKTGNTMSWSIECPEGKGRGEMTLQGADKFTGFMEFSSDQGNMRMDMSGRRIGNCDPGSDPVVVDGAAVPTTAEMQQMQADMGKQIESANTEACAESISAMQLTLFTLEGSPCAKHKPAFCKRLQTGDGAMQVVTQDASGETLNQALAYCGLQKDKVMVNACKQASATKQWDFLGSHCKADADALAQKHCAGRDYTSVYATEFGSFCTHYAADLMSDGGATTAAEQKEETAVEKGTKLLKDLIKW